MPTATVTVREIKNKESGLDLSIPSHTVSPGLLGGTVEYHIVVVSNLSYFKSPKHKDSDVVQFTLSKKFGQFEEFHKKLNEKFSGTIFPPLSKKAFLMNEAVVRERRASLEHFMKYLAVVPKLISSPVFLEFLGVNSIKAGKFRKSDGFEVKDEGTENKEEDEDKDKDEEERTTGAFDEEEADSELFVRDEDEEEEMDMFEGSSLNTDTAAMFAEPDLGGGLAEVEGEDLFLPGSVIEKTITVSDPTEDNENFDLLRIEDDLDQLLTTKAKKPQAETQSEIKDETSLPSEKPKPVPAPRKLKPQLPSKPQQVSTKPQLPIKPVSSKPAVPGNKPKPPLPSKPGPKGDNSQAPTDSKVESGNVDLSSDDIMKYITENSTLDDDLDLF